MNEIIEAFKEIESMLKSDMLNQLDVDLYTVSKKSMYTIHQTLKEYIREHYNTQSINQSISTSFKGE